MIEFSVTFIYISERCFICMTVHDKVPGERASEQENVCVRARARMCVYLHMCTCMNVSLHRVKCYSCPAPEHMKLMSHEFNLSS